MPSQCFTIISSAKYLVAFEISFQAISEMTKYRVPCDVYNL